jgi:hypothetical protein
LICKLQQAALDWAAYFAERTCRWARFRHANPQFSDGQLVQLAPAISRNVPGGSYEVTKKLPESRGEFEYRIKSMNEPHERVARESELQDV